MQAAVAPQPLGLVAHTGKVVKVSGRLRGDLWEARFLRVVLEEGYQEVSGEVIGFNVIQGPHGPISLPHQRICI